MIRFSELDGEKMNNTIKLNNGALVAAREVKGKMSSYTFANLTQAEAHADKWGGKVCKFRGVSTDMRY